MQYFMEKKMTSYNFDKQIILPECLRTQTFTVPRNYHMKDFSYLEEQ